MQSVNTSSAPAIFSGRFQRIKHKYPTNFSHLNYEKPKLKLSKCKYRITFRGPTIWNKFLGDMEKEIENPPLFKLKVKTALISFDNEIKHF